MFCFRKFTLIFPLSFLMNGCGYTVPNYIDEQRFKNTSQFITIAKAQHYQPISIHSISEIAINQNYIAYLCEADKTVKVCVFKQDQPNRLRSIKKIDLPLAKEHESYLLINEFDHLFVISKDLTRAGESNNKTHPIIAFEINLNHSSVRKLPFVDGLETKNELIESLIQENRYRKKNNNEIGFDGLIYEEIYNTDAIQPDSNIDANELSMLSVIKASYEIIKSLVQDLVQTFSTLFQDDPDKQMYRLGHTISDRPLSFEELPENFPQAFQDKLLSEYTKVDCLQPISTHQMDYLV